VRRKPERAAYDRESVFAVIDAALSCHVGLVRDGLPVVLPTIHARLGDTVYIHGSSAAGYIRDTRRAGAGGVPVSLAFTLIDGLVLARSARNHSLNYRSAVVFGEAVLVTDVAEKLAALEAITDHIVPGRWAEVAQPNDDDMRTTDVLAVAIAEASAKIRTGVPVEDDGRGESVAWAGVIPLVTSHGAPERSPFVDEGTRPPAW
jgi:nitroimidazol reductase NimA-like FMN-containing flavoprotein (pyridoxamine 5'-phosphate oxidase superfamily)